MNSKVIIDTHLIDELLLEVINQCCGISDDLNKIDNQCISAYEDACNYLTERGYLTTKNGRIYQIVEKKGDGG